MTTSFIVKPSPEGIFLGIGECMVELSETGDAQLARAFAGDVFNTLWYFEANSKPGWHPEFFSAVGDDPLSSEMIQFMQAGGIGVRHLQRLPLKRPGLYMIHLDGAERSFSYWRDNSAARSMLVDPSRLTEALGTADVAYLSGITLGILSAADRDVLFDALRDCDATVVFDPNIRPALWSDLDEMKDAITRAGEVAQIIFPSFDDEAQFFGDKTSEDTIKRYGCDGRLIVVKDGPGAVIVGENGKQYRFDTIPVHDAVDTTGAGDSFNGAFMAEYLVSCDIAQSVACAQACSAAVIRHKGALIPR